MRFQGTAYRAHHPKWAFSPLSGAAAALYGARFNPTGIEALYLGLTLETAFLEITQGLPDKFKPCTICCYDVDCDPVLDLRGAESRQTQGVRLADMNCAWKLIASQGETLPSWILAQRFIESGVAGILVPSFAHGAGPQHQNLVLWSWGPQLPHRVSVHDPSGALPQNQLAWPE